MSSTFPAMRGQMGCVEYYLLSFKASELTRLVTYPSEMPGWDAEEIEEIYQRKINYSRVRSQIAPYLANNRSTRFFGSLIVAAFDFDRHVTFTPLTRMSAVSASKLPAEHKEAGEKIGMLTLSGGTVMVPLDGQHRLKALEFALAGADQGGNRIPGIDGEGNRELGNEDISVILVPYEPTQARKIFTKVNRYARSPSSAETYVTDDDDLFAVLARWVANNIGGRLVKYDKTSLTVNDPHFTTLTILRTCCEAIVRDNYPVKMVDQWSSKAGLIDRDVLDAYKRTVWNDTWKRLLSSDGIRVFGDATQHPSNAGDEIRRVIRRENLLGKPVAQECLVLAFLILVGKTTKLSWKTACENLNRIRWDINPENMTDIWQNVLWIGGATGRINTKNRPLSTRLIAYMAGAKLGPEQRKDLLEEYRNQFPEDQRNRRLPKRVVD